MLQSAFKATGLVGVLGVAACTAGAPSQTCTDAFEALITDPGFRKVTIGFNADLARQRMAQENTALFIGLGAFATAAQQVEYNKRDGDKVQPSTLNTLRRADAVASCPSFTKIVKSDRKGLEFLIDGYPPRERAKIIAYAAANVAKGE